MNRPNITLFSPEGDAGSGGVTTSPGAEPKAAPASENFYEASTTTDKGAGDTSKVTAKQDFTDGKTSVKKTAVTDDKPYIDLTEKKVQTPGEDDETDVTAEVAPVEKPPVAQVLKLDAESIAELRKAVTPAAPTAKTEDSLPSPQKLREMLNPVEVTGELLGELGFENTTPQQVAGFQKFTNAIVKNAVSIARVIIDQKAKQFEAALSPISANMEKAQMDEVKTSFYSEHKDLTKYEKIVKLASAEVDPVKADGSPKSRAEIFKEVAEKTRATLKEYGVNLTPANPGADGEVEQVQVTKVPSPNKLSSSGRSGGDTNGQRGKPNDADADIYKRG